MSPFVQSIVVAVFSIAAGTIITYLRSLSAQVRALEIAMSKLDTQVGPLWSRVQAQIASDLHHPHARYAEMDGLLERLEALTITDNERSRLKVLLDERALDMHSDITVSQRDSAKIMGAVMDKVLVERDSDSPKEIELISVEKSVSIQEKGPGNPDKR